MRTGARNIVDADIQARRGGASGVRPMTVAPTNFDRGGGRLRAYGPLIFFGAGVVVGIRAWVADAFQEGRPITQTQLLDVRAARRRCIARRHTGRRRREAGGGCRVVAPAIQRVGDFWL